MENKKRKVFSLLMIVTIITMLLSISAYATDTATNTKGYTFRVTVDKTELTYSNDTPQTITMSIIPSSALPNISAFDYKFVCNNELTLKNIESGDSKYTMSLDANRESDNSGLNWIDMSLAQPSGITCLGKITFEVPAGMPVGEYTIGVKNLGIASLVNYVTDKWETGASCSTTFEIKATTTPVVKHTVKLDADNGSEATTEKVDNNAKATKPSNPTKEGYDFAGWYNGETEYNFDTPVTGDITLKAKWTAKVVPVEKHTVTFDADNGTTATREEVENNAKVTKPADPAKEGYDFKGWYNGDTAYNFDTPVTGSITLKAKWTAKDVPVTKHTVTLDADNGTAATTEKVDNNAKATKPSNPTKEGYDFKGWYNGDTAYNFDTPVTGDITLKAKWDKKVAPVVKHTVTLDADNGSEVTTEKVDNNAKATKPADPTKEGYDFKGWYNGDTAYNFDTPVTEDITLKAKWDKKVSVKHIVTFDADNGTAATTEKVDNNAKATKPSNPTKEGYDFAGWYNGETVYNFDTPVTGDITLKAKWTAKVVPVEKHTVTFDADNGTTATREEVENNAKVTKPADPAKEGFDFAGWYNGEAEYNFDTPVTGDITLKAKWTEKVVKTEKPNITIDLLTEEVIYTLNENANELKVVANSTDGGTISYQWQKTEFDNMSYKDISSAIDPVYTPLTVNLGTTYYRCEITNTKNGEKESVFSKIAKVIVNESVVEKHIVSFNVGNGSKITTKVVEDNTAVTKPADPTKEGYEFKGWYLGEATEAYDFKTPVTGDITLKARWAKKTIGGSTSGRGHSSSSKGGSATTPITNTKKEVLLNATVSGNTAIATIKVSDVKAAKGLTIKSGIADVAFNEKATEEIAVKAKGLTLEVKKVENSSLTTEQQSKVGTDTVLDINLKAGNEAVINFSGGKATVTVPYTLKAGEKAEGMVVYYLADNGKTETVDSKYYVNNNTMVFTTNHFSKYVIAYNEKVAEAKVAEKVNFSDVKANDWYKESVNALAAKGILTGKTSNTFAPNEKITRAEFVAVLARMSGQEMPSGKTTFSDVAENSWYGQYVTWAVNAGIAKGTSETIFTPNANITRQDMAVMITRYAQYMKKNITGTNEATKFADEAQIAGYAKDAVVTMQKAGIINGQKEANGSNRFMPKKNATRAEAAKMIYQMIK